jgi:hypothetical protein
MYSVVGTQSFLTSGCQVADFPANKIKRCRGINGWLEQYYGRILAEFGQKWPKRGCMCSKSLIAKMRKRHKKTFKLLYEATG